MFALFSQRATLPFWMQSFFPHVLNFPIYFYCYFFLSAFSFTLAFFILSTISISCIEHKRKTFHGKNYKTTKQSNLSLCLRKQKLIHQRIVFLPRLTSSFKVVWERWQLQATDFAFLIIQKGNDLQFIFLSITILTF